MRPQRNPTCGWPPGRRARAIFLVIITMCASTVAASQPRAEAEFRVTQTSRIGGEGSWDYAEYDSARHRLFVARVGGGVEIDGLITLAPSDRSSGTRFGHPAPELRQRSVRPLGQKHRRGIRATATSAERAAMLAADGRATAAAFVRRDLTVGGGIGRGAASGR